MPRNAKAQATAGVAFDLNRKLRLERILFDQLTTFHADLVQLFTRNVGLKGVAPPIRSFEADLLSLLRGHYTTVQETFSGDTGRKLPSDVAPKQMELAAIAAALATYFDKTATSHADEVITTTEGDMQTSIRLAYQEQPADAPALSSLELATFAGAILHHKLLARRVTIATTETQLAAEATKATEAEILSGIQPTILGGSPRQVQPPKRWDSVGDNRVRDAHLAADGQTVPVSGAFTVDGEKLKYPGDTSLGASVGNVINCRCSATYDAPAIADARRSLS